MVIIYGIPNCDTIKKTIHFFKRRGIEFCFHDFRKNGLETKLLKTWVKQVGLPKLLNKYSTTWKALSPEEQADANAGTGYLKLMTQKPSLIKRPVIEWPDGSITTGFDEGLFLEKAAGPTT